MTPMQAIRAKCLDCCETFLEIRHCPIQTCALYPFHMGKNPNMRREYTDEEKAELVKRLSRQK